MSLYSILELEPDATEELIKKAYRRLSLKFHPDKNKDALMTRKYHEIKEAYNILSDLDSRKKYDSSKGFTAAAAAATVVSAVIHQHQQPVRPICTENLIIKTISVPIKMAFEGGKLPLQIDRWVENYFETVTLYIDIFEGIDDNELIILKGEGNRGGDIKVFVKVVNDSEFVRSGLDLQYTKTITLKEAFCGFQFELKLLNDKVLTITNRRGNIISPNFEKRIVNMGMKRDHRVGCLMIKFNVEFPTFLTPNSIDCFEELL